MFNSIVHKFARFRHDVLFIVCLATIGFGFVVAGNLSNTLGVALLFIGVSAFYIVAVLAESDINSQLPSKIRATSESFFALSEKLVYIPTALVFAWIGQKYNIADAFSWLGITVMIYLLGFIIFSSKYVKQVSGQHDRAH